MAEGKIMAGKGADEVSQGRMGFKDSLGFQGELDPASRRCMDLIK